VARGLSTSGNGSIVVSTLRWLSASLSPSGGDGGGAGRLAEFLAGVRRTSIEAGRYKAGWTRLSAGERKRRAAAVAAGPGTGFRGDWKTVWRMPPRHVLERGALLPPLVDCRVPIDGDGSNGGDWK
jgi:hypothetical protein